jgi:hypothetical protein
MSLDKANTKKQPETNIQPLQPGKVVRL